MAPKVTRREFLTLAAGATALGLGAGSCSSGSSESADAQTGSVLPKPADAPFDTVVVLMMENRSFDHMLGWLPGRQRQAGGPHLRRRRRRRARDLAAGARLAGLRLPGPVPHLAGDGDRTTTTARATASSRPSPTATSSRSATTPRTTCRSSRALAKGYTPFDHYFCSMLGPDLAEPALPAVRHDRIDITRLLPEPRDAPARHLETAIFDRAARRRPDRRLLLLRRADDRAVRQQEVRRHHVPDRPVLGRRQGRQAAQRHLRRPRLHRRTPSSTARRTTTTPTAASRSAEGFVAQVHDALTNSPQWDRMVFVLNFDESGGFYDHVPPPACRTTPCSRARARPRPQAARLPRAGHRHGPVRPAARSRRRARTSTARS